MADCVGHAKMSVDPNNNIATIDIWCTGTCTGDTCKAQWVNGNDIGDLHFKNGYASEEEPGVVHQIRQYEIRDTVENIKVPFTCDCGGTSQKYFVPIDRLERSTTVGDIVIKVIEIVLLFGVPLVLKLFTKKKVTAAELTTVAESMGTEIGKMKGK